MWINVGIHKFIWVTTRKHPQSDPSSREKSNCRGDSSKRELTLKKWTNKPHLATVSPSSILSYLSIGDNFHTHSCWYKVECNSSSNFHRRPFLVLPIKKQKQQCMQSHKHPNTSSLFHITSFTSLRHLLHAASSSLRPVKSRKSLLPLWCSNQVLLPWVPLWSLLSLCNQILSLIVFIEI